MAISLNGATENAELHAGHRESIKNGTDIARWTTREQ